MMEFNDLMAGRWSCREFRKEPVPDDVLRDIFATAQRTGSWCNTQPWHVHLISGDAATWFGEQLTKAVEADPNGVSADLTLPHAYVGKYQERRREAGYALYESLGIERSDREARDLQMLRNYSFFGAPHVAVITTDKNQGTYGALDCGGYVANLTTAALDRGVASIAQGALGMQAGVIRKLLGLPEDRLVVCGVALGWPDVEAPVNQFRTSRAELDDFVTEVTQTPKGASS